ncbi:MAG: DNA primase [Fuerstiella sp.]|nr:DNA primase [Fuerstiella sp.]
MSTGFGDDFKEQVRTSTDLVELISATVALVPNGRDYKGLCPFHDDRNPSFNVYPDRQTYRCWVCDMGGDCFTWIQEIEKVGFPEAVRILAERARLDLPAAWSNKGKRGPSNSEKSDLIAVVEWAVNQMEQSLWTGTQGQLARRYLQERNISEETIRKFRLGYHPEDWSWLLNTSRGRFTGKQLVDVSLAGERDDGTRYDNLVGRLVFPILDEQGRTVSFGGRVLPGSNITSDAKYWNGTETSIFQKRRILYAFDRARESIRKRKQAIVVEGYMDCIACHQAGITNVVATLGTAMTDDHVRFLNRFAETIVLNYDGDQPGRNAAERSVARFIAQDVDLRVLILADGQDPADYLERNSADEFQALIDSAPEAWEYKLQTVLSRYGITSVHGKQQVLNEMLEFLAVGPRLQGTVREDLILRRVCGLIQTDELRARRQLKDLRQRHSTRRTFRQDEEHFVPPDPVVKTGLELAERELLEIIVSCPRHTSYIRHHIGPDDFEQPQHRRLLELCFDLEEAGELPEFHRIVTAANSSAEILSLANSVADSAQEKGISELMAEQSADENGSDTSVPLHLERVLHPLLERRARYHTLQSTHKMTQTETSLSSLNSDAKEALRRIYNFRQGQMGNEPPSFK